MIKLFCRHKRIKLFEVYEYLDPEFTSTEKDIRVKCECLNCGKKLEFQAECDLFKKALDKKVLEIYLLHTKLNLLKYDEVFKNLADIDKEKAND
jgi:hypothetical protein